jgi:hypothetical protein
MAVALAVHCKGNSSLSSAAAAQGFSPVQGVPSISFCHSSTVSGTYTYAAVVTLKPSYLAPFCGTIKDTAATDGVTRVHFTPSAMGLPPPRVLDFLSKTQLSVSSESHSSSQKKHLPPFKPPKANDHTGMRAKHAAGDDNLHVDTPSKYDADVDYINITSAKETSGVANQSINELDAEREMIERDRKVIMERAFAPLNGDDGCETEGFHLCRPKEELDLIVYVVSNLQLHTSLKEMEPDPERDRLTSYWRKYEHGNKWVTLFHAEEIQVHGSTPCTIVRRLEGKGRGKKKKPRRVVVSREQVFDAIDEWYHGNSHVDMERTATYCQEKNFNCTQRLVRNYC